MEHFPQYRKLKDKSYYKVLSPQEMEEIQRLGKQFLLFHISAITFLDINLIRDILEGDQGRYEPISEQEYQTWKNAALPSS